MFSKGKMQNISGIIDRIYSGEDGRSQEIIVNGRRVLLKSDQNAHDKRFIFSGVFTVNESEKNDYDAYIFCVKAKLPEVFIFCGEQLLSYISRYKQNRRVSALYFGRTKEGSLVDYKDNKEIDVSKFYNNWSILQA
ncbi:hypothetical protein FC65_GL001252 [Ligilactobacillus acidipiscis DSM 15836]|uniref:Uncharacterized protein n=1 Tax=Ligilactobacillus acidipiscis DSM 15836 TaxID=1423716 RepID=A0ABR5PHZ2_9LACO|nr:hypothetical protein [Ligilactobacillus acidipiscis]KRM19446.1 hypothetical protein FC65_GL001252 [Ligilactobacillus acidipiscis DSM 15836]GAW64426.1 hypothetical protein Lacidipiscis_01620 [Ligilactobacillus acidipiscis]GEN22017.1 hypothetical protein LAC02_52980 [Ligilactobacillus acidipiscis]